MAFNEKVIKVKAIIVNELYKDFLCEVFLSSETHFLYV